MMRDATSVGKDQFEKGESISDVVGANMSLLFIYYSILTL